MSGSREMNLVYLYYSGNTTTILSLSDKSKQLFTFVTNTQAGDLIITFDRMCGMVR